MFSTLSKGAKGSNLSVWDSAGQIGVFRYRVRGFAMAFCGRHSISCGYEWMFPLDNRRSETFIHVAHFTNFLLPLLPLRKPCPYVITIHDDHVLRYPGYNPACKLYRRGVLSRAVKMADFIIVPSRHVNKIFVISFRCSSREKYMYYTTVHL